MLSIILMTLLDVFDNCEILFFSGGARVIMLMDNGCWDITGKIEFFDGGVKFDVANLI